MSWPGESTMVENRGETDPRSTDETRSCIECGYSLRGLPARTRCPECGCPNRPLPKDSAAFEALQPALIRRFRIGAWIAAISVAAFVGWGVSGWFVALSPSIRGASIAATALAWIIATFLLTPTIDHPNARWRGLSGRGGVRLAARMLALGWIPAAASSALASLGWNPTGWQGPLLMWASILGSTAGLIGLAALCALLARFADWMRDEHAAKALTLVCWGSALLTPLIFLFMAAASLLGGLVGRPDPFMMCVVLAIWLGALAALPVGLFSLARTLDWAARWRREESERNLRLRDSIRSRPAPE
jgi:hypothetical protein